MDTAPPLRRREVLQTGVALASVGLLTNSCGLDTSATRGQSAAQPVEHPPMADLDRVADRFGTVDPAQRHLMLIPAGEGVIYGVHVNGLLVRHQHVGWRDGTDQWTDEGTPIGTGWQVYRSAVAAADGQFFALRPDGALVWYRYITADPTSDPATHLAADSSPGPTAGHGNWAPRSGTILRQDLTDITQLAGGWDGVLYGVTGAGELRWFRYLAGDGDTKPEAWATRSGAIIAGSWSGQTFADPGGVVYRLADNTVHRHHYLAGDGSGGDGAWGTPSSVPTPAPHRAILSNTEGVLYTVRLDTAVRPNLNEELRWHRLTVDSAGTACWAPEKHGVPVARGFTVADTTLQGYPGKLAVTAGEQVGFGVSTALDNYHVTAVRLATVYDEAPRFGPIEVPGQLQPFQADYRARGCGWRAAFTIDVGADWPSGIYGARITGPYGWQVTWPFAVRPPAPRAQFAYLWPTNTYNAYNAWDGHDQYTPRDLGQPRVFSFLRPGVTTEGATGGDLALLRFLATEGIEIDCYHDADLHTSYEWLHRYRALLLGAHPEYWSYEMRRNLQRYLDRGGRVIYPGGNGIYEPVTYSPDLTALTFRSPDGKRHPFREEGLPETELLGVGYNWRSFGTFAPYKVVRDHFLLAGTGLRVGQEFGGPTASGHEVDTALGLRGAAREKEIFAVGGNPKGGANMCLAKRGPGWVFSAGSLTFTSVLGDPHIQQILRNVFRYAAD